MTNGVKTFTISINGLTESISAVDSLNKQLNVLENKITALQGKTINVATSSSRGGSKGTEELSEQDKLQKQILANEEKIEMVRDKDYQILLRQKELIKQITTEQKAQLASSKIEDASSYNLNTLQGIKERLRDLKAAMQTTDLGDTDAFNKLTTEANELNEKLKEVEKSYGVFSRDVGHYENAAEGFKGLKLDIGGMTQEFDNAKQALMTLKKEMQTLATKKDLGIITDEESERLKSLIPTVKQLESSIADAGKPMDALMDTMQSFVALAQAGKGLAAFFGVDGTGIDESIKNLVALQNAMQGLQTIQKQLQTEEGLGKYFSKGNKAIDNFTKKLFGVKKATTEVTTASKAQAAATSTVATTSKAATTAEVAQTTATAGLTVGMGAATVAARLLSTALKAIGIGLLLEGISLAIDGIKSLVSWINRETEEEKKAKKEAEEHAEIVKAGAEAYANAAARIRQYQIRINTFNGTAKQEKKLVEELNNEFGNQIGNFKSLDKWKKALIELSPIYLQTLRDEAVLTQLAAKWADTYVKKLMLMDSVKNLPAFIKEGMEKMFDDELSRLESFMNEPSKRLNENRQKLPSGTSTTSELKDALKAEKNYEKFKHQNMEDGLKKTIQLIKDEWKERLSLAQGKRKKEEEINEIYEKRIEDAILAHTKKLRDTYKQFYDNIARLAEASNEKRLKNTISEADKERQAVEALRADLFKNVYSYGIQGKNTLSIDTAKTLGIVSRGNPTDELDELGYKVADASKKFTKEVNKLVELERQVSYLENRIAAEAYRNSDTNELEKELAEAQKLYEEHYDKLKEEYHEGAIETQKELLYQESYSKDLMSIAHERYAAMDIYWEKRLQLEKEAAEKEYKAQLEVERDKYNLEKDSQAKRFLEMKESLEKSKQLRINSGEDAVKVEADFQRKYDNLLNAHTEHLRELDEEWGHIQNQLLAERNEKVANIESAKLQDILQYYRDFYAALNALEERQPVTNAIGIVNIKETRANYKQLIESYKHVAKSLNEERKYIKANKIFTDEEKEEALREIDAFETDLGERLDNAKNNMANTFGLFVESIQQYIQVLGQSIQTVMSSLDDYADYQLDKQQETLDKQNDLLQEKLSEQEEIIQKHSDKVDSIEDELSSARGDRRQHLIDQLNAEIAAQRAAEVERQRIEREQAELEKKQEALEKKRAKQEYERKLRDILVSGALAVSNAFATSPFVPVGLAMGALATSLTAFQYAMAKKAKPFKDGGIISGPRHKDGGVKVLGGHAEVEGGEFITNRVSTAKNVQLLEYINSKKKTVDLSDMIDFYSEKPRATIKNIRSRFANGGQLATLPNDISLDDRLINAIEGYSNRPIYVAVTEIENVQNRLNQVRVLAGM